MNSIRHLIVAGSLVCASLVPSAAHAVKTSASATASPGITQSASQTSGSNRPGSHAGAPLSSGLLALGSANDAQTAHSTEEPNREDARLAQREQGAPELRDFRGGRVYIYLGGGVTLLLVLLLVLILL